MSRPSRDRPAVLRPESTVGDRISVSVSPNGVTVWTPGSWTGLALLEWRAERPQALQERLVRRTPGSDRAGDHCVEGEAPSVSGPPRQARDAGDTQHAAVPVPDRLPVELPASARRNDVLLLHLARRWHRRRHPQPVALAGAWEPGTISRPEPGDTQDLHVAAGAPAGTTEKDAAKKVPGRKRGLAVDVLGLPRWRYWQPPCTTTRCWTDRGRDLRGDEGAGGPGVQEDRGRPQCWRGHRGWRSSSATRPTAASLPTGQVVRTTSFPSLRPCSRSSWAVLISSIP